MLKLKSIPIDQKKLYVFSAAFAAVLLPLLFVNKSVSRPITAVLLVLSAVTAILLLKKRSILSINKDMILLLMAVIGALCVVIYYLSGISFGFHTNPYTSDFSVSALLFIYIAISITSVEIVRCVLLMQNDKVAAVCSYVAGVIADVLISHSSLSFVNFNGFMDLVGLTLFPAITANFLYSYISKRYGIYPIIAYRLITTLYVYVIPFLSGIPDSLLAFANLLLPIAVFAFIDLLYEKKAKRALEKPKKYAYIGFSTLILLMISFVMLISCQFKHGLLVVATESMTGEINKGDAIVYERYDDQDIDENQIIVFEKNDSKIIHRVVKIEHINGETRYYTKGDFNNENDQGYITDSNIVGITNFKIPYIGYPTLWMRSLVLGVN